MRSAHAVVQVPQVLASSKLTKEPEFIYIASFNVYNLGAVESRYKDVNQTLDNRIPVRIENLARVLAIGDFDIIVLQEVISGKPGHVAISDLVRALERNHSLTYRYVLSKHIGKGLISEAMAFLYKPNRVQLEMVNDTDSVVSNIEIPGRDLVRTQWEAGHFDFTLISAHLAWGNHVNRRAGYKKIAKIFDKPKSWSHDPDLIVLGDFNRFGGGGETVRALPYDSDKFRVPNVIFFDPEFSKCKEVEKCSIKGKGVPDDDPQLLSTTVACNTYVYDMIMFSSDASEEFPAKLGKAQYGTDFGIIHFDQPNGFGYQLGADKLQHEDLKNAYSDHRPIWIRFRIDDPSVADD